MTNHFDDAHTPDHLGDRLPEGLAGDLLDAARPARVGAGATSGIVARAAGRRRRRRATIGGVAALACAAAIGVPVALSAGAGTSDQNQVVASDPTGNQAPSAATGQSGFTCPRLVSEAAPIQDPAEARALTRARQRTIAAVTKEFAGDLGLVEVGAGEAESAAAPILVVWHGEVPAALADLVDQGRDGFGFRVVPAAYSDAELEAAIKNARPQLMAGDFRLDACADNSGLIASAPATVVLDPASHETFPSTVPLTPELAAAPSHTGVPTEVSDAGPVGVIGTERNTVRVGGGWIRGRAVVRGIPLKTQP